MSAHPPQHETDPDATTIRPPAPATTGTPVPPARGRRSAARRRVPLVALVGGAVVVLLGVLYLVGYLLAGDRLPRDAEVAGVAVGGLTRTGAIDKVTAELAPRSTAPLQVSANGATADISPAAAGLSVDIPASVDAAGGGRSANPAQIVKVLTGGSATAAVVAVDEVQLRSAVQAVTAELDQPPADATLAFDGAEIQQTAGRPGVAVQQEPAAAAVRDAFLATRSGPVELPVDVTEPGITTAEVDSVVAQFARPAVSGPVTLRAGAGKSFQVTPAMIGAAVSFVVEDGTLVPRLDAEKLRSQAGAVVQKVELSKPKNATVRIVDGRPKVIPAVDGASVSADALAEAVQPVLTKAGADRAADVGLTGSKARFSTADAEKLGITEVIGQFTTYFPYLPYRNTNIGRAAEKIDNTVLKPGDTFSLNRIVGERTRANGFTEGFIIQDSKFKKELGGGVSQVATTTFNAMFFAGLQDVEHQPHTLYIDRYPAGREATVAWPTVDMRFRNNTDHAVLVEASVVKGTSSRRGSITVKMWSTKTYDRITSTAPVRSGFTTGRTLEDDSSDCEPMSPVRGFDADYQRLFYRDGKVVEREKFHWRYGPTDKVTCT